MKVHENRAINWNARLRITGMKRRTHWGMLVGIAAFGLAGCGGVGAQSGGARGTDEVLRVQSCSTSRQVTLGETRVWGNDIELARDDRGESGVDYRGRIGTQAVSLSIKGDAVVGPNTEFRWIACDGSRAGERCASGRVLGKRAVVRVAKDALTGDIDGRGFTLDGVDGRHFAVGGTCRVEYPFRSVDFVRGDLFELALITMGG